MVDFFKIFQLPQASTMAPKVDALYDFIHWVSVVSFVIIVGGMVYFIWKFRRRREGEPTPYITGHTPTELSVAGVLFIIVMVIFYWGWKDYSKIIQSSPNALEINVMARQWLWEFEYTNGRKIVNELVVPKGTPVRLIMGSADVLHSFYVPNFRLKQDVVPGAYTKLDFTATSVGEQQVFCAEYCGTAHSKMLAKLKVMEPKDYQRWQTTWEVEQSLGIQPAGAAETTAGQAPETVVENPVERGKKLFAEKGCTACHSVSGQVLVGPSLKEVFGHEVELADGSKVMADENYIRESLMEPQLKLVKGFPPVMPTYKGTLKDDEINALVTYIKSLRN
ncbi:MAG: cytochrome c oxidase subunit II [Deltaproteobacteria bacterium]|nr:cytochrome c oxidase subunit II [Deltaproteobacteria bacterium]